MRMKLYQIDLKRGERSSTSFVVATDEHSASELVLDRDDVLDQTSDGFTVTRVDETLPDDRKEGLEALLERSAPGFASYCAPIGWIAHVAPVARLRPFTIEEGNGKLIYVLAPSGGVAAGVYCSSSDLIDGEYRLFRVRDGLVGFDGEENADLAALMETGPIGMIKWSAEHGWSID